ncbi:hypothetical protein WT15_20230 [Burkholderia stagnalis]|uniref:SMI1/KNR4 family protein n=1 Tax=Burkholderia stagnalis TaxID=1503054 RepID=UPI0007535A34|nr:SMI1/KNR4 family protein [Burkholderia stagnalis]AOK56542.1 hypothetical protein WT74_28115 [Burkholderia stagnalis]KVN76077.1 hypothetical protein WT15_20230 [Burkholderia stagnalis]KWO32038.1 hypothetical protein WT96_22755 [Burkholderia stagnalis]KWO32137.1 hypothetical protein WT95_00675 [Burkholderia stagnalis]
MLPPVPQAYLDYLGSHGVFEGLTLDEAPPGYVALWPVDKIADYNSDFEIETYAPGFVAFGGDGGGELLEFDVAGAVFMLPMIGVEPQYATHIAESFQELAMRFDV